MMLSAARFGLRAAVFPRGPAPGPLRAPVFFRDAAPGPLRAPFLSRATVTNNAAGPTAGPTTATTANLTWLEREVNGVASSEAAELDLLHKEICSMAAELDKARADHAANLHDCKLQVWKNTSAVVLAGGFFLLAGLYLTE